jgi:hypothetical protein
LIESDVILATSAPKERPEYKRDFLTCLASPEGQLVAFSYRKSWFEGGLLTEGLENASATVVFCNRKRGAQEFEFLAVRQVTIRELLPKSSSKLQETTAITVTFEVGPLPRISDADLPDLRRSWNKAIGGLEHRPRPPTHPEVKKARFVLQHPRLADSKGTASKDSWRALSEELGQCNSLKDAFFFRVGDLTRLSDGQARKDPTKKPAGSLPSVFHLEPNAEYELPMEAYSKSGATSYSDAISPVSSSDKLSVQAVTQNSAGRGSEAVLVLRSGEVVRPQIATLIIRGAKGFEHRVPRVELATRIAPRWWLAAVLVILIAVGVFLGGLPEGALGLSNGFVYLLKVVGGLIVGGATLYGLGRAPGVS